RPDPDKKLAPWPPHGDGEVEVRRFSDEWTEARWVAGRVRQLHDSGTEPRWSEFAVLCRSSRLFVPLQESFAEEGIPVEIVGLAGLQGEARRPVGEFLAEVIRRTGLLAEVDASLEVERAQATKRNLAAFLDEVHAFSPLEGELTLRAFLDYVDTTLAGDKQEWSPVQPSAENSVKVMTIHQAKGLEFGTVFVPGFAKDL